MTPDTRPICISGCRAFVRESDGSFRVVDSVPLLGGCAPAASSPQPPAPCEATGAHNHSSSER